MRCDLCQLSYEQHKEEPGCFSGKGLTGYDELADDEIRLLEVRGVMAALSEYNLGDYISRRWNLTGDEIRLLAFLEDEIKKMQPEPIER